MGKYRPITSKSRTVTVRFPVSEVNLLEELGAKNGISRHTVIRRAITDAIESGRIVALAASAQTKTPA